MWKLEKLMLIQPWYLGSCQTDPLSENPSSHLQLCIKAHQRFTFLCNLKTFFIDTLRQVVDIYVPCAIRMHMETHNIINYFIYVATDVLSGQECTRRRRRRMTDCSFFLPFIFIVQSIANAQFSHTKMQLIYTSQHSICYVNYWRKNGVTMQLGLVTLLLPCGIVKFFIKRHVQSPLFSLTR